MKFTHITLRYIACSMLASSLSASAWAGNEVVTTVNNVPLHEEQLDLLVKSYVARGLKNGDELRKQVTEELVNREAVAQEALKLGLDKKPDMAAAIESVKRDLLVNAFQADYAARHPVSDDEIAALYKQQKEAAGDKEYRISDVVVKTEAEAREILAALKKGEKMETLAREKSIDPTGRAAGGDIGWKVPVLLIPSVRDVVRNLARGQTSEQVESPVGWHVIRLDDVRHYDFPPLEKVKPLLLQQLQLLATRRAIAEIRNKTKVN